jgi:hypothetical protein
MQRWQINFTFTSTALSFSLGIMNGMIPKRWRWMIDGADLFGMTGERHLELELQSFNIDALIVLFSDVKLLNLLLCSIIKEL